MNTSRRSWRRWVAPLALIGCFQSAPAVAQRIRVTPAPADVRRAPAGVVETFAFREPPEGIVAVTAWKPGTRLPIVTTGGVPPITYSLAAAEDRELFQILELPVASNPGIPQKDLPGRRPSLPSPQRVLHFKGLGPEGRFQYGQVFSVGIIARDARGVQITRTFKLAALPARTTRFQHDSSVVRGQATRAQATLEFLPPGGKVQVVKTETHDLPRPDGSADTWCWFAAELGATRPSAFAGADGKVSFDLEGHFFTYDEHKTGPCGITLQLNVTPPGETKARTVWSVATTETVRIAAPVTYRVERTWALNTKFRFDFQPPLPGVCVGASIFTGGTFPIGAFQDGNGDLALAVRSGPLGTDCSAISRAWAIPDGFHLTSLDWDVQRTGEKCCMGDLCLPSSSSPAKGIIVPGAIPSEVPSFFESGSRDGKLKDATGMPAGTNPHEGRLVRIFNTMQARLACKETASNDQGVKVTLKSLTFEGPPGRTFP